FLLSEIETSKGELSKMRVLSCDRRATMFVVEEVLPIRYSRQSQYRVYLRHRCCDCGKFQQLQFQQFLHTLKAKTT
ncbi:hypothetical protein PIB30_115594, partial [Stylosanthes scabra]|nr:hypothetical protein [Stylosanthes scabra]